MCGFSGIASYPLPTHDCLSKSLNALKHRGPDSDGLWFSNCRNVALCHSRLAIQDISSESNQPIVSVCGRFVLAYNGEIYNLRLLKQMFPVPNSRHMSDTQFLINALIAYPLSELLEEIDGMFAFAFFDIRLNKLVLARDRHGQKPLYYALKGDKFAFASELGALLPLLSSSPELSEDAVILFLGLGYIPDPLCIYKDILKLKPGSFLEYDVKTQSVFSKDFILTKEQKPRFENQDLANSSHSEIVTKFSLILADTVREHLISDRPVGAFLSGGIDSGLVVSEMRRLLGPSFHTFSVAFQDKNYDESERANNIAKYLGTQHQSILFTASHAVELVPKLSSYFHEPFSDPSALPMLLLASEAKKTNPVVLTGDGGDEFFRGYSWHHSKRIFSIYSYISSLPRFPLSLLHFVSDREFNYSLKGPSRRFQFLNSRTSLELWLYLVSRPLISIPTMVNMLSKYYKPGPSKSYVHNIMNYDASIYMPGNVLVKVDRTTMAFGLESRAPLLSRNIVDFASSLTPEQHRCGFESKAILRTALQQRLPQHLISTSKKGFGCPIGVWLRNELREWCQDVLNKTPILSSSILHEPSLKVFVHDYLACKHNDARSAFSILSLLDFAS